MKPAAPDLHPYWISWYSGERALRRAEIPGPWWITGETTDGSVVVVALVSAVDEADAMARVERGHKIPIGGMIWRFCEAKPDGWTPPGDRFPGPEARR